MNTDDLLAGLADDQSNAQRAVFDAYYRRTVQLVRKHLRGRIERRVDASDVALSAFRSLFLHARDDNFEIRQQSEIWRILVTITLNKLRNQIRRHSALKRDASREDQLALEGHREATREPGPDDVAALNDELELVLSQLKPYHREIGERILMGEPLDMVAAKVNRSMRTVRRVESQLERLVRQRMDEIER